MFAFVKAPRPTLVAASPRSAAFAASARAAEPAPAPSSVGSDWEHVASDVPSTPYEPLREPRHGPAFVLSGAGEAEETLQAAYAEYVRSGAAAAAACFESLLARDRENGRLAIAQAACTLSAKLLAQSSLPTVGSGACAAVGAPSQPPSTFGTRGAQAANGIAAATPLLVSMLLDEKASRHRTLCALLHETLPPDVLRMPLRARAYEVVGMGDSGARAAAGAAGDGADRCADADATEQAWAAERTLAEVLLDNEARLESARALRAEHNALATLASGSDAAGARAESTTDLGASLALAQLHASLSRCASGGAAAPIAAGAAGAAFYRDVDRIEAWLPELAGAIAAVGAQCAGPDGSQRAASVAHALLLLLRVGEAFVGAAERATAGASPRAPTERAAAGGPFARWLCDSNARRSLTHCARIVTAWCAQPAPSRLGGGGGDASVGMGEQTALELLGAARALAGAGVRALVGRTAAEWAAVAGADGRPEAETAARSAPQFKRAVCLLARARREAARALVPAEPSAAGAPGARGGAAGRCAHTLALDMCDEFHEFSLLAELSSSGEARGESGERVAHYLRRFHRTAAPGARALWAWELGPAPPAEADAESADAATGGGFVHALLRYYLACGSSTLPLLLQLPAECDDDVELFLKAHPRLLWLHHLKVGARESATDASAAAAEARADLGAGAGAFEPRAPFDPLAAVPWCADASDGTAASSNETANGGARAFARAAETLYPQALTETNSLSVRSLFAHVGKLAHLASAPAAPAGASADMPLSAVAGQLFGAMPPKPVAVLVAPTESSVGPATAAPAGVPATWPLERADDLIYVVEAQRMLDGLYGASDAPVRSAVELIMETLSHAADSNGGRGGDGDGGRSDGGDGDGGRGAPALSESDVFLALDLWHRSRWEEDDAAADDRAPRVGADGGALAPRSGEASQLERVSRARADILCAIWSEAISAELPTVWARLSAPSAGWEGDDQLAATAQSSLLFRAIVYQHAHSRIDTLAYIGRAVALRLEVDDPPVPEHVRASLPQRVHQVCELALSHAEQQASLAQAAEHAVDDASGMQL
ncbi:hypothetical protein KFE25_006472 [Diacronema lutheri]|uniref:Uncharacterized protein n=1 Tax=Diacronema lutheri TaxID=2081491 RepID=A0A8J6CCL3_DIALT|nr:hypothetical protein KFE25_006472 [Diacronema lutheri]